MARTKTCSANPPKTHMISKETTKRRGRLNLGSQTILRTLLKVEDDLIYAEENSVKVEGQSLNLSQSLAKSDYSPLIKSEEEEYIPEQIHLASSQSSFFPQSRERSPERAILSAQQFTEVKEIDFRIFLDSVSRTRVYSALLVDEMGRVIFSDKLGHQLFEGSLNNFETLKIQNLLLSTLKTSYLNELRATKVFDQTTIFNWIIYSKNTKRRYSKVPFMGSSHSFDTFYRFLKGISIRFRPVKILLKDYKNVEGFWNPKFFLSSESIKCFLLEAKLSSEMPEISRSALWTDVILKKYIKDNTKKAERCVEQSSQQSESKFADLIYNSSVSSPAEQPYSGENERTQLQSKKQNRNSVMHAADINPTPEGGVKLITDIMIDDLY